MHVEYDNIHFIVLETLLIPRCNVSFFNICREPLVLLYRTIILTCPAWCTSVLVTFADPIPFHKYVWIRGPATVQSKILDLYSLILVPLEPVSFDVSEIRVNPDVSEARIEPILLTYLGSCRIYLARHRKRCRPSTILCRCPF